MRNRILSVLFVYSLTACGSSTPMLATPIPDAPQATRSPGSSVAVAYLNDPDFGGPYGLYFYGPTGTTPAHSINNVAVNALTSDASGNVYAVLSGGGVKVYSASGSQIRSLQGTTGPADVAVDASRNVYVADGVLDGARGRIAVYQPGATTPSSLITSGIDGPTRVATDDAGNLYVLNRAIGRFHRETISEYPPHATKPLRIIPVWHGTYAVAVDRHNGTIYVAADNAKTIAVYGAHGTKPARTIADNIGLIFGLAVDGNGRLYVESGSSASDSVRIFVPGGTTPIQRISVRGGSDYCFNRASGITVDASEDVYVLSCVYDIHSSATVREYSASGKLVRTFSSARIAIGLTTLP